jgi:hypothetical protein
MPQICYTSPSFQERKPTPGMFYIFELYYVKLGLVLVGNSSRLLYYTFVKAL